MKKLFFILFFLVSVGANAQLIVGQQYGRDANGNTLPLALSSTIALTSTNLPSNGVWSTGWVRRGQYIAAQITLYSTVSGSYKIEYSDDSSTYSPSMPIINVSYAPTQGTRKGAFDIGATYVKFSYINGATAQTSFKFEIRFLTTRAQPSMETLNARGADSRFAEWVKSFAETKTSDTTNDYAPIYRTGNRLNSADSIINTVKVTIDSSQSRKNISIISMPALPPGSNSLGSVSINNPYSVSASDSTKYRKLISIDNLDTSVSITSLPPLPSGTNNIGNVGIAGPITTISSALTIYNVDYTPTSGVQTLKTSAGVISSIQALNPTSSDLFIQFFNTTGAVTLGTTVPIWSQPLDATVGCNFNNGNGLDFSTGIKFAITTTARGSGASNTTININFGLKK